MANDHRIVETLSVMLVRYHKERDRDGIDPPTTEWTRAEISGARSLLEAILGDDARGRIFAEVRKRTGMGIPHRDREWVGWDSEAKGATGVNADTSAAT
jgi:hypothetical protein